MEEDKLILTTQTYSHSHVSERMNSISDKRTAYREEATVTFIRCSNGNL